MTEKKAQQLVKYVRTKTQRRFKLSQDDIHLILELAQEHPKWSVSRIFYEASRPKIRRGLLIYPTPKVLDALKDAGKRYDVSINYLLHQILGDWRNDYIALIKKEEPK